MLPLIAAGGAPPFFIELAALIVAGAVIGYVCYRLGLVPIVGFLIAGVVIGPNALGLVQDQEVVDAAAEVGVILLLFTIGIEFSLEKLAKIQRLIFGGGGLQVGLATGLTAGLMMWLYDTSWQAGLFTGFLVALSSTAIVLKLLGDRGETNTDTGQVGLGLLIFQDLAIIVMVMLVPMLSGTGGTGIDVALALGKAALLIVVVLVIARRLMPILIERLAKTCSQELFLLGLIAICFGTAYLTSLADVSLSLGAFLAGLMVSESRFSEYAFGEIMPLQILFSATFFMSVGMLLDVGFLIANAPVILTTIGLILLIKLITTAVSVKALGYSWSVVASSAFLLAQVGEFSFVLEKVGREAGLYAAGQEATGSQTFIAATVILMVFTPLLTSFGGRWGAKLDAAEDEVMPEEDQPEIDEGHFEHMENHVIVAGYGRAARRLVRVLHGSGIPHLIITLNPTRANEAEQLGLPVLRGDITRQHILVAAGIRRAKVLVIPDDDASMAHRIITMARMENPTLHVVTSTASLTHVEELEHAGADKIIVEEIENVVQLFAVIMHDYEVEAEEIERHVDVMRSMGYEALRKPLEASTPPSVVCHLDMHGLATRHITVREGAPAANHALPDLDLDRRYGMVYKAVHRADTTIKPVPPDFVLAAHDVLVVEGDAAAFDAIGPLFAPPGEAQFLQSAAATGYQGDGEGPPTPEVYGANWCVLTGGFRAYFKRHDIPYTYYNIEQDADANNRVLAWNDGQRKFPMVVIGRHVMKNPKLDTLDAALEAEGWEDALRAGS